MANRGRPRKAEYEDVPDEFKTKVNGLDREAIRRVMSEVSCDQIELMKAKKEDQHLQECKNTYSDAGAIYKDGSKANKAKLEFCKATLDSMGG